MKKGIAFVIPNVDFSDSPLGKVTRSVNEAELIVRKYEEKIGATEFRIQIESFVNSLMEKGLWEKLDGIYLMLGSSFDTMKINLKDVDNLALEFKENATANSSSVSFSNAIAISTPTIASYNLGTNEGRFAFVRASYTKNGINQGNVFAYGGNGVSYGIGTLMGKSAQVFSLNKNGSAEIVLDTEPVTGYHNIMMVIDTGDTPTLPMYMYRDGNLVAQGSQSSAGIKYQTTTYTLLGGNAHNIVASPFSNVGSEISPNGYLFNGSVNFFAIGKMNKDEAVEFNTLANNLITAMSK